MRYSRRKLSLLLVPLVSFAVAQTAPRISPKDLPPTDDPREIVRRLLDQDDSNMKLARNYTCQKREHERHLDKDGKLKSEETKTYDVLVFYDEPYEKLVQINDKLLDAKQQKKEDEKLDKFLSKRKNESEADRKKRLAAQEKDKEKERAFVHDILDAYNFRRLTDEQMDGHEVFVIEATPRPEYRPHSTETKFLPKLRGKLWVDKKEYQFVKLEAEVTDTISFGLFLFRLHKGATLQFEQSRINDEVWLPRRGYISASARIALLKNEGLQADFTYSNYRKFTTDSRLLPGVEEAKPKQ